MLRSSIKVLADEIPIAALSLGARSDDDTESSVLCYETVTNFCRAAKGAAQVCVMCGEGGASTARASSSGGCVIPRQNKDVCRDCDKALWRLCGSLEYFKWCKGCKNFLLVGNFSQKLDAAKCDKCRERGRTSYLLKKASGSGGAKQTAAGTVAVSQVACGRPRARSCCSLDQEASVFEESEEEATASGRSAASSLVELARERDAVDRTLGGGACGGVVSGTFGCELSQFRKRANSCCSDATDATLDCGDDDRTDDAVRPPNAPGMLFELAMIHSTVLALEQRAEQVAPLRCQLAFAREQLADALQREQRLQVQLARLRRDADSSAAASDYEAEKKDEIKRPRLISFDENTTTTLATTS